MHQWTHHIHSTTPDFHAPPRAYRSRVHPFLRVVCRRKRRQEQNKLWKVRALLCEKVEGQRTHYLVDWEPCDGQTWPAEWVPADRVTAGAITEFKATVPLAMAKDVYQHLEPVHELVARRLLHKLAELLNSNAMAGEYVIDFPELSLLDTARGYMEKIRRPWLLKSAVAPLIAEGNEQTARNAIMRPVIKGKIDGGSFFEELLLDSMPDVCAFCSFHR